MTRCKWSAAMFLVLVAAVLEVSWSFTAQPIATHMRQPSTSHSLAPLRSSPPSDTERPEQSFVRPTRFNRKRAHGGGGRVRRPRKKATTDNKEPNKNNGFGWLAPLLLVAIVSSLLFGGDDDLDNDPSFYFYQSSSYERSVYRNGEYDTSRKESVRTNMPSVYIQQQSTDREPSERTKYLMMEDRQSFDKELEEEVENMMRMQKQMYKDVFPF